VRFLALPAPLEVGAILFQATSYLGAFPFTELAPAILNFEALVRAVTLVTGRYKKVLKRRPDRLRLLFRSLAIYDRYSRPSDAGVVKEGGLAETETEESAVIYDSDDSEDLSLAALDALDAIDVYHHAEQPSLERARIPVENMRKLVVLLIVFAPLEVNEPLAGFVDRFTPEGLEGLHRTADCILRAFGIKDPNSGISYRTFKKTIRPSMPYMFEHGLPALFEHFVFSKNLDAHKPQDVTGREPLLPHNGEIMNPDVLGQLSLFIQRDRLFRRVRPLYAGSEAGFSLGSFETKVCKWNAPTIFLVRGTRIPDAPETSTERAFLDRLPPRRHPPGLDSGDGRVVFGVFLETPWKHTHKECFGDARTLLFQLEPVHQIFRASTSTADYAYFNRDDSIGFGVQPQQFKKHHRTSPYFNLGPVSLVLDQGLEYGVFTHVGNGGAFHSGRHGDWQDRFEIEEIEVWGCGGESEAEAQRRAWQWEEREALLRRQINLGKDIEADRALLEMAGLVGGQRSGGSM